MEAHYQSAEKTAVQVPVAQSRRIDRQDPGGKPIRLDPSQEIRNGRMPVLVTESQGRGDHRHCTARALKQGRAVVDGVGGEQSEKYHRVRPVGVRVLASFK